VLHSLSESEEGGEDENDDGDDDDDDDDDGADECYLALKGLFCAPIKLLLVVGSMLVYFGTRLIPIDPQKHFEKTFCI